jgi:predicted neutral ceramidase superfamily lipid hydrolase
VYASQASPGREVDVSSGQTVYLVSLIVAAVAVLISGLFMVKSVREREPSFVWAFALVFVVAAFLVAVYFRRLL